MSTTCRSISPSPGATRLPGRCSILSSSSSDGASLRTKRIVRSAHLLRPRTDRRGASSMAGYLLKRLIATLLTFWAMSFVTFVIMELPPGDYASARMSSMSAAGIKVDAEMIERLRELYRLNDPMIVRYWAWLSGILSGETGYSLAYNLPVGQMISDQLPNTLLVEGSTLLFMWVVAVPLGIYSAVKQYSIMDYAGSALGFIGLAIPNFLLALLLMWIAY